MTKSLGQIAFGLTPARLKYWDLMDQTGRDVYENMAHAVAAHIRAEMAAVQLSLLQALEYAQEWLKKAQHGDNCFLQDDGGEFDNCFCGLDSLLINMEAALIAEAKQPVGCQDLTDDDIDQIITWQADCGRGDIGFQGFCDNIIKAFSTQFAATAQPVRRGDQWQPIETAPKGKKLIVGYLNRGGNWRSVMACYYLPQTLEAADDCHYDVNEQGYAPEGWYEESETHESILPTDEPPTHWMHRPTPPQPEQLKDQI